MFGRETAMTMTMCQKKFMRLERTGATQEEPGGLPQQNGNDEEQGHNLLVSRRDEEEPKPVNADHELFYKSNEVCRKNRTPEIPFSPSDNRGICFDRDREGECRREILINADEDAAGRGQSAAHEKG